MAKYEDWKISMAYFAKDASMFSFLFKKRLSPYRCSTRAPTFSGVFMVSAWCHQKSILCLIFTVHPSVFFLPLMFFTKVLIKPLEKYWRIQGLLQPSSLDDDWAIVQDRESCRIKAQAVSGDLYNAGFVINKEKSEWDPTQLLHSFGITWNSVLGTLKIVERRIVKITNTIDHIIEADLKVSARVLASFTDQIISTGPVVGNFGRIMTRHCALSTLCKDSWDSVFRLDDYCK